MSVGRLVCLLTFGASGGIWLGGMNGVGPPIDGCISAGEYPG